MKCINDAVNEGIQRVKNDTDDLFVFELDFASDVHNTSRSNRMDFPILDLIVAMNLLQ